MKKTVLILCANVLVLIISLSMYQYFFVNIKIRTLSLQAQDIVMLSSDLRDMPNYIKDMQLTKASKILTDYVVCFQKNQFVFNILIFILIFTLVALIVIALSHIGRYDKVTAEIAKIGKNKILGGVCLGVGIFFIFNPFLFKLQSHINAILNSEYNVSFNKEYVNMLKSSLESLNNVFNCVYYFLATVIISIGVYMIVPSARGK